MSEISIIVPVYNSEKYLHCCIDSILMQSYTNYDLILVDDGSTDNSGKICDEYVALRPTFISVIHVENGGPAIARNIGIAYSQNHSDSKWIAFVDSDDWLHPQFLEKLLFAAIKGETLISTCGYRVSDCEEPCIVTYTSEPLSFYITSPDDVFTEGGKTLCSYVWKNLYRKIIWEDVFFPPGELWEDVSTTYRVLFKVTNISVVSEELYYYRYNPNSITVSAWSPQNISSIYAIERMLNDKLLDGHSMVLAIIQEKYVYALSNQIVKSIEYENSRVLECDLREQRKSLKKKLRLGLKKYKQNPALKFDNCKWCYETAYPFLMSIYWTVFAKIKKGYEKYKRT